MMSNFDGNKEEEKKKTIEGGKKRRLTVNNIKGKKEVHYRVPATTPVSLVTVTLVTSTLSAAKPTWMPMAASKPALNKLDSALPSAQSAGQPSMVT